MGVMDYSETYARYLPKWQKCRDAIAGEDEVKAKGETYLPRPSGMDEKDYKGYIGRAQFFDAGGRTLDGLVGLIGRKPVIIEVPDGMERYLDNVDGRGHSAGSFIMACIKDVLTTGWGSVLVDMPASGGAVSQRDFEDQGLGAYMTYYKAEASTRWRWQSDGRRQVLRYVILREETEVDTGDYGTETRDFYRVCEIDGDGRYRQRLYNDRAEVVSEVEPKWRGGNFREIPFAFLSARDAPEEPLLLDLVNVNMSHYRKSADYENGLHWTGVPTPYERGWQPETKYDNDGKEIAEKPMKLGGSQFLYFPEGTEQVGFLEYSGSGLSQLASAMQTDEDRMAILGARIIAQQRKGVEAAETAKIHNAAENSVLANFANEMSGIFSRLIRIYLEWSSGQEISPEDVRVEINTDYDVVAMSAPELNALVSLWQSGGIAKRDLFRNLKEGEILPADRNFDEMSAEIEEEQKSGLSPAE